MSFDLVLFGGTGYLRKGPEGDQSFVAQARAAVKVDADLYVVYGGANDTLDVFVSHTKKLKDVAEAARRTFRTLVEGAGNAPVVVIGPVWPKFPIAKGARKLRDVLKKEAEAAAYVEEQLGRNPNIKDVLIMADGLVKHRDVALVMKAVGSVETEGNQLHVAVMETR